MSMIIKAPFFSSLNLVFSLCIGQYFIVELWPESIKLPEQFLRKSTEFTSQNPTTVNSPVRN